MTHRFHPPGPGFTVALVASLALSLGGCRFETVPEENVKASVETMLEHMAQAWNDGDLDGVMSYYADGNASTLVTPDGPVSGRASIRAVYAPWFEAGARRPQIRFENVEVRTLPPLVGIVTGRLVRDSDGSKASSGWFTLVVRRVGDGWRIVHDHPGFVYTPTPTHDGVRPAAGARAGSRDIKEGMEEST